MASTSVRITRTGMLFVGAALVCLFLYLGFPRLMFSRFFEEKVSMKVLLSVSIDVARKGGDRVKAIREDPSRMKERVKGETKEGAKEMLTAADLESHRIMHGGLSRVFPNLKIISEEHDDTDVHVDAPEPQRFLPELESLESSDDIPISDLTVWIDPLDATQEYTENLTKYVTTMVCVAIKDRPIIGVVHQPFTGETTWAYVGHGVSKNLQSLTMSDKDSKVENIVVSRSHAGNVEDFIHSYKATADMKVTPAGGAGYKVLQVLHGKADVYLHITAIKKWDICAGNALVDATGGQMTTLKDAIIGYSPTGDVVTSDGLLVSQRLDADTHDQFIEKFSIWMSTRKTKAERKPK